MEDQSVKYRRKGRIAAFITAVIVIIVMFISFATSTAEEGGGESILIQFGDPDAGMSDPYEPSADSPDEYVEAEELPDVPDSDVGPEVLTDPDSDAPVIKTEDKPKRNESNSKDKEVEKPAEKPKAPRFQGSTFNSGGGSKDGKKPGTEGDPDGKGDNPTGGLVPGTGGDIGGGLSGRGVARRDRPNNNTNVFGTVVVSVCVDQSGKVVSATYTQDGSTTSNGGLVSISIASAKKFQFQPNPNAPDKQCGTITFRFMPKPKE